MSMSRRKFIKNACIAFAAQAFFRGANSWAQSSDYDFYFTRLSYESGDWEVDERMPANVLNSLIEYTSLRVDIKERIIPLSDPAMLNVLLKVLRLGIAKLHQSVPSHITKRCV